MGGRSYVRIEDGGTNQESKECRRVMKKLHSRFCRGQCQMKAVPSRRKFANTWWIGVVGSRN